MQEGSRQIMIWLLLLILLGGTAGGVWWYSQDASGRQLEDQSEVEVKLD